MTIDIELEKRLRLLEIKLDCLLATLELKPSGRMMIGQQSKLDENCEPTHGLVELDVAAKALGISPGHLRNQQWAEKIPHYRIGTSVRFDVSELREHFRRKPRRCRMLQEE